MITEELRALYARVAVNREPRSTSKSPFGGQLKLVWADVLATSAFALAVIIRHWSEPYRMPEDSEAAVGR